MYAAALELVEVEASVEAEAKVGLVGLDDRVNSGGLDR